MKKFAVLLSGCGVYDGAEIHEATLSLWAIMKQGATYSIFAPDKPQHHVINHLTGEEMPESRNVLVESARIARGQIQALSEYKAADFDALLLPGGFGAAKNLCDFAFKGAEMTVDPEVESALRETVEQGKAIGALCISPVLLAKVFESASITIGADPATAQAVEEMGGIHLKTGHGEVVRDARLNLFTTPCYMLDANILQIAEGAENIVAAIMKEIG